MVISNVVYMGMGIDQRVYIRSLQAFLSQSFDDNFFLALWAGIDQYLSLARDNKRNRRPGIEYFARLIS